MRVGRWALAGTWVLVILAATMTPAWGWIQPFKFCVFCGERPASDSIANMIMFFPLGLTVGSITQRPRHALIVAVVFSTAIELVQSHFIPGRDGNLGDIIFNTAGAAIGVMILETRTQWQDPTVQRARIFGGLATIFATLLVVLTGFFMTPSLPNTEWFGQWVPQFGNMGYYYGDVLDVRSAGRLIPSRRLDDRGALRRDVLAGVPLIVTTTIARPPRRLAAIFSVHDQNQRRMLLIGTDGRDLGFYIGRRSTDFGLLEPLLHVPNALAGTRAGDTVVLVVRREGRAMCVGRQADVRCNIGLTAGAGWQLIVRATTFRGAVRWLNFVWLFVLLLPVGYWWRFTWMTAAAVVLVCLLAPFTFGLALTPVLEWGGGIVGAMLGALLRHRSSQESSSIVFEFVPSQATPSS